MTPAEKILALYEGDHVKLAADVLRFMQHGYVISTPDFFLMGRPTRKASPLAVHKDGNDTWLVWAAAGDLRKIIAAMPCPLPWLAWSRRGKRLRFWRIESTLRHAARTVFPQPSARNIQP